MDIYSIIENSKFVKKYLYPNHWISGSSTIVHPLLFFHDEKNGFISCTIQIDESKIHWRKTFIQLYKELIDNLVKNGVVIETYSITNYDGSCPRAAYIKIKTK